MGTYSDYLKGIEIPFFEAIIQKNVMLKTIAFSLIIKGCKDLGNKKD